MKNIIVITGGQRSGKSTYAEQLALDSDDHPAYIATARVWDDEFRQRIIRHQERRGPQWVNIEEPMYLSKHNVNGMTVLVDCVTLWCTNFFFNESTSNNPSAKEAEQQVDRALNALKNEFDKFTSQDATFIFVTNEIGMGEVSANTIQRHFTDLLGWMNQYIASKANKIILMVSGIPVTIKQI